MQLKSIDKQVVVVMGASSGIGRETALRLAERGAMLVLSARSEWGLRTLTDEIRRKGGVAIAVPADVAVFEQVQAVADAAIREYGRLDTWVHLAAVSIYAPFEHTQPQELRRLLEVNLLGHAHGALAALPYLRREGRGALIHVSSVEAEVALPLQSAYAASKHGVVGLIDSLRLELMREGVPISVTNVMPASINTPLFNKALTRLGVKPRGVAPIYQPEVVARAILFAAQHPVRDLVPGGAALPLLWAHRIAPSLVDAFLLGVGFQGQLSSEPKPPDAPNNLLEPMPGYYDKVEGDFSNEALPTSLLTTLQLSPIYQRTAQALRAALTTAVLQGQSLWSTSQHAVGSTLGGAVRTLMGPGPRRPAPQGPQPPLQTMAPQGPPPPVS